MRALVVLAITSANLLTAPARADDRTTDSSSYDQQRLLAVVVDAQRPTADRQAAALSLLNRDDTEPVRLLDALLPLLEAVEPAAQRELAVRLARQAGAGLLDELITLAGDEAVSPSIRQGAVLALGHQRVPRAAAVLVDLTDSAENDTLREAAFASLATLTGRDDLGRDSQRWQAWWREVEGLSSQQWQQHLFDGLVRQRREARQHQRVLESRLVDAHRSLYRTAEAAERPAQLMRLLEDPLEVVRQLGMDLAVQRLVDDQPFGEPLRQTLRARLDDPSPAIRQRATLLLRDLADGPAADRVAHRLAEAVEDVEAVLRAELLMMSRLPRIEAVERSLVLLASPAIRDEAAGALNAALDADRLTYQQGVRALERTREQLDAGSPPTPSIVLLLGRLGDEQDWQRIEGWLDADDDAVKQAAARAWADSDRSLTALVERAGDVRIEPIAMLAAARRGGSSATFRTLVRFEPEGEQATERWERALEAMAGRVPGEAVVTAVRELERRGVSRALGRRMLAAALERGEASAARQGADERAALLLARARLRLSAGDAEAALRDFDRLAEMEVELSAAQQAQRQRGMIRANLWTHRFDRAFAIARAMVEAGGEPVAGRNPLNENDSPLDLLFEAAEASAIAGEADQLDRLVTGIRTLAGPAMGTGMSQRLKALDTRLGQLRSDAAEVDVDPDPEASETPEGAEADAEPDDDEPNAA